MCSRIDRAPVAAQEERELEEEVEAARRAVLEQAAQRRREEGELDDEDLLIGAPPTGGARAGCFRHRQIRMSCSHDVNPWSAATCMVAADLQVKGHGCLMTCICSVSMVGWHFGSWGRLRWAACAIGGSSMPSTIPYHQTARR